MKFNNPLLASPNISQNFSLSFEHCNLNKYPDSCLKLDGDVVNSFQTLFMVIWRLKRKPELHVWEGEALNHIYSFLINTTSPLVDMKYNSPNANRSRPEYSK